MSDSCKSVDEVKAFHVSVDHFNSEQTQKMYDHWAPTYQQDLETMKYRAPQLVVDFLNANYPGNREDVLVLDVACGTGWVAQLMLEKGFKRFVGVDGSEAMLELANKTGLYQDLKLALLGTQQLPAETGTYDVVVIVGALRYGYVPVSVIRELCSAAKPGGYICMSRVNLKTDSGQKYKASLDQERQLMEEEQLWSLVVSKEMKNYMMDFYDDNVDDLEHCYLEGTVYLYKKSLN